MGFVLCRSVLGPVAGLVCLFFATHASAQEEPLRLLPETPVMDEQAPLSATRTISRTVDLSTLWGLTSQSLMRTVLPSLPAATASPTVHILQRSLLLAPTARLKDKTDPLLTIRIERLLAMGEIENAQALLRAVPANAMTPELYRLRIDATLLGVDPAPACIDVTEALQIPDPDLYLARVQVFCEILGGKMRNAEQSLTMLRARNLNDPAFFLASENMLQITESREAVSMPQPTPLHLTMLRMARMPLPADSINSPVPAILRGIALSPNAPLETRLLAAEKAESSGALPTDSLRQLYLGAMIPKQDLTLVSAQKADGTARGRAMLFRLASTQTQAAAKIAVINHALSLAGDGAEKIKVLRLYASQISQIKPTPALLNFAPLAIRSLVSDNRGGAAAVWLSLLRQTAPNSLEASRMLSELWPILRMAEVSGSSPWSPGAMMAWNDARNSSGDSAELIREQLLLATTLLASLDETIPSEDIIFLLEQDGMMPALKPLSVPGMTAVLGLGRAAREGRKGEILLWSLLAFKEIGSVETIPVTLLQQIIPALRQAGFEANARSLALDTALAAGL